MACSGPEFPDSYSNRSQWKEHTDARRAVDLGPFVPFAHPVTTLAPVEREHYRGYGAGGVADRDDQGRGTMTGGGACRARRDFLVQGANGAGKVATTSGAQVAERGRRTRETAAAGA